MNNTPVVPTAPSGSVAVPMAPATLTDVRNAHGALMREWREIEDAEDAAHRAEILREQVRRAGSDIADPGERDEAQGILDYWISKVAALPERRSPSYIALDDYVGAAAARAGSSARQVYETLGSEDERLAVRKLFEDLLTKGPNGIERSGSRTREVLVRRLRIETLDRILEAFVDSGAIARRPGATPADDSFEVTDANLAQSWPTLDSWLDGTADYERKRDILLQRAERWDKLGRSGDYLAKGEELKGINRFEGESAMLDAYLKASQKGQLWFWWKAVVVLVVIAFAITLFALSFHYTRGKLAAEQERTRLDREAAKAQAKTVQAQRPNMLDAADAPPEPISKIPRLRLPALEGAIWLGSDQIPQVSAPFWGGTATPPSGAGIGTAYRVLTDINLREEMPPTVGDYVFGPQKAVVRAGTLLIVIGKTQGFNRPNGRQYWAKVQVVPRTYIQYTGMEKAEVARLRQRLSEVGFDVPAAEGIGSAKDKREVRYFDEMDRPVADLLLNQLNANVGTGGARNRFVCRSFAGSRASNRFALEIWVDPDARPSGSSACN